MSFKEIPGQQKAVALLKSAFLNNRVSHAYIFIGPSGTGKSEAAINFAKLLLCQSVTDAEPCDQCPSCLKVAAGNHPDVQVLSADGQFIRIDDLREACRKLSLRGFESSRKALIISDGAALNEESSNALLKTLEEPSGDAVIIVLADSVKSVLPTIASRCQKVVFPVLSESETGRLLVERYKVPQKEACYLARLSDGCLGKALRFHDAAFFSKREEFLAYFLKRDLSSMEGNGRKEPQERVQELFIFLSGWLRDLLVAKACDGDQNFINADRKSEIMEMASSLEIDDICGELDSLAEAAFDLRHNMNRRVALARLNIELWKSSHK